MITVYTSAVFAKKLLVSAGIISSAIALSACQEKVLVTPEQFDHTENGAFTDSGRYFFAADLTNEEKPSTIVELTKEGDIVETAVVIEGSFEGKDCDFNGLTSYQNILYASCTFAVDAATGGLPSTGASVLVRVDTDKAANDAGFVQTAALFGEGSLPNGMATDADGNLFISDSQSWLKTYTAADIRPAIVKVNIDDSNGFSISQEAWHYPGLDDKFPNGIRVTDDHLYFVNGVELKRFDILSDGSAGMDLTLYRARMCGLMDDFDIADNGYIVTTELTSNDALLMSILWPGMPCAFSNIEGFLIGVNGTGLGGKLGEYAYKDGTVPSSVIFAKGPMFEPNSVISTAFFTGGIQQVIHE